MSFHALERANEPRRCREAPQASSRGEKHVVIHDIGCSRQQSVSKAWGAVDTVISQHRTKPTARTPLR